MARSGEDIHAPSASVVCDAEYRHERALLLWELLLDVGGGFLFGVALGVAAVVWGLQQVAV
jgi:hypothetical protein